MNNFRTTNVGTALQLKGKICIISVFIHVGKKHCDRQWWIQWCESVRENLHTATHWLQGEAKRYGHKVKFVYKEFGAEGDINVDEVPKHNESNAYQFTYLLLPKMGFPNENAYLEWVRKKTKCDQSLIVFFVDYPGMLSYALPYFNTCGNYVESCIVSYGDSKKPISIAHEILHLFGAWDLYQYYGFIQNDYDDSFRVEKNKKLFPYSVMLTGDSLDTREIDEITAWLVGLKEEKEWYHWFSPYVKEFPWDKIVRLMGYSNENEIPRPVFRGHQRKKQLGHTRQPSHPLQTKSNGHPFLIFFIVSLLLVAAACISYYYSLK